jgi:hypothetical protein
MKILVQQSRFGCDLDLIYLCLQFRSRVLCRIETIVIDASSCSCWHSLSARSVPQWNTLKPCFNVTLFTLYLRQNQHNSASIDDLSPVEYSDILLLTKVLLLTSSHLRSQFDYSSNLPCLPGDFVAVT